ncbi:hypothetical protein [Candidatus Magnetomonas plexicatena]|uniref:hypothetical protein n=1 Tax=Candidatus Magnetomonas plexicatena TaxID=2552947 RepID=UPI001C77E94F|nr:cytochrome c [Nitrospirales bacterium LBB_01]
MKRNVLLQFAAMALLAAVPFAVYAHEGGKHPDQGSNSLIEEMLILQKAFQEIVVAVVLKDNKGVINAIEPMKGTMEKTHESAHTGKISLPKNSGKLDKFIKMDKEFHHNLHLLEESAQKNDYKNMHTLTKKLLDGCINCHSTFRK